MQGLVENSLLRNKAKFVDDLGYDTNRADKSSDRVKQKRQFEARGKGDLEAVGINSFPTFWSDWATW